MSNSIGSTQEMNTLKTIVYSVSHDGTKMPIIDTQVARVGLTSDVHVHLHVCSYDYICGPRYDREAVSWLHSILKKYFITYEHNLGIHVCWTA